jgi:hypothetical protein
VDPLFIWIESTALSVFIREWPSLWGFPFILVLHTWGLAFLVGANVAIGARALGAAPSVPLPTLEPYYRVMWIGFWINAVSGVLLLIAYPTKALTNPLFYVKLLLIAAALVIAQRIRRELRHIIPGPVSGLAALSLACWAGAIFAGRFLAYTCTRLMVESSC